MYEISHDLILADSMMPLGAVHPNSLGRFTAQDHARPPGPAEIGRDWRPNSGGTQPPVSFYVYIMASRQNGTLYIGSTDDLLRRAFEHRTSALPGFTKKYGVGRLVWFEVHETRESARLLERQMKKWQRAWKLQLIERQNPGWLDLFDELGLG